MFRAFGAVDLNALAPSHESLVIDRRAGIASGDGVSIRWRVGDAHVAADGPLLVIAWGRARHADRAADADEARWWLQRYAKRADALLDGVGGGFAAVVVDAAQRRVHAFVDRFSIETLCYRIDAGRVSFSDAARSVPGARIADLDADALYDYLYLHAIPSPRTFFSSVERLRAAHRLQVTTEGPAIHRWWSPRFVENDAASLEARMRAFVDAVRTSVVEEADGDATACFLSGGTDSSTLAGLLRRAREAPVHAYSIGFAADGYDEMAYSRIAAGHFGLTLHEHYVTAADVVEFVPRIAAHLDQPFGNSSVLPAYACAQYAKRDGFTTMIAGDGGDELFGGNTRYATQRLFDVYQRIPASLRRQLDPVGDSQAFRALPGLKQAAGYVRHARVPMPDRLQSFNVLDRVGNTGVLDADYLQRVDRSRLARERRDVWDESSGSSLVNRMLAYDWKYTLADSDLPKVRAAAELAGVRVAYPFLASRVVDLSLGIPPHWKVRGLTLRWFFKRALRDVLPVQILRKRKHGFGLPFGPWLKSDARLRGFAIDALEGIAKRGYIRRDAPALVLGRVESAPGYYGELVWVLLMLEHWFRAQDRREASPVASR